VIKILLLLVFALSTWPIGAQESPPPLSIGIFPAVSFPLGEDARFFSTGGGADVGMSYRFPGAPLLSLGGGIGYGLLPVDLDTAVSVLSLGAGAGLVLDISPRLYATLEGYGGLYYGFLNDASGPGSAFPFLRSAANLNLLVTPLVSIGIGGCYRNYLGLYQGAEVGIGTRVFLGSSAAWRGEPAAAKPRPLAEAQQAERLRIKVAVFEEIFPVFFKYYDQHPIGAAVLVNSGKEPIQKLSVSLFIKQYMDNPKACVAPVELKPGEEQPLVLNALFTESVLQITESTKVSAEITVDYTIGKERYTDRYVETVRIYDRNATTWDDDRRAAAFVTAKDPAVLSLSKMVASLASGRGQGSVNLNLRTAMALHAALDVCGMSYVVDPKTPYKELSARKSAVDFLQFPRQTLQYRAGDCDDLSILTCALLESVGVETAFITVPGHIFVAFSLAMTPEEAKKAFSYVDDLIFRETQTWIPVEATQTQGGFLKAWQAGARQWREATAREVARFHPVHQAWTLYEPVGLPGGGEPGQLPDSEKVATLYLQELTAFAAREIYPRVAQVEAEMAGKGESPSLLNQLGILYARYGITDRAEREFARALALDAEYVPALVNLGNLQFKAQGAKAALGYYEKAYRLAPDNPTVLVSLAKANYELENYGTVNEALSRLNEIRPDLARKFAYLEMRGPEAEKAAAVGNAREELLWAE
jgi:tetratricopeptide (TPR) repeat protein